MFGIGNRIFGLDIFIRINARLGLRFRLCGCKGKFVSLKYLIHMCKSL